MEEFHQEGELECKIFTGAEGAAADSGEGQPSESAGRGGEAFQDDIETMCCGQTSA